MDPVMGACWNIRSRPGLGTHLVHISSLYQASNATLVVNAIELSTILELVGQKATFPIMISYKGDAKGRASPRKFWLLYVGVTIIPNLDKISLK